jgi:prophage regulatory protein
MDRYLSRDEVIHATGLSRSTIQRKEAKGEFPRRRKISANRVGWLESEVAEWLQSQEPAAVEHPGAGTGTDG